MSKAPNLREVNPACCETCRFWFPEQEMGCIRHHIDTIALQLCDDHQFVEG